MTDTKPWYASRTIWASLVMVGATLAGMIGMPVAQDEAAGLTDAILQAVAAVAAIATIFGRLAARSRLS